jgi:arsenite methyltransferase
MPPPRFVLKQLSNPNGILGHLVARMLNKLNRSDNEATLDELKLERSHRVLDVGFGGGVSFPRLLRECTEGCITGAEISEDMVRRAKRKWSAEVKSDRLDVRTASVDSLPWEDAFFDRILSANTIYFWPDLESGIAELRRVLAPGGCLGLLCASVPTHEENGFAEMGFRVEEIDFYVERFRTAGFSAVEIIERNDGNGTRIIKAYR